MANLSTSSVRSSRTPTRLRALVATLSGMGNSAPKRPRQRLLLVALLILLGPDLVLRGLLAVIVGFQLFQLVADRTGVELALGIRRRGAAVAAAAGSGGLLLPLWAPAAADGWAEARLAG